MRTQMKEDNAELKRDIQKEIQGIRTVVKNEFQAVRNEIKTLRADLRNAEERLQRRLLATHRISVKVCHHVSCGHSQR